MSRKPNDYDVKYLENYLTDVKVQLDNIKTYWDNNSWIDSEGDKKGNSFTFHSKLIEKFYELLAKHNELTGITEFYNAQNKDTKEELRKGSKKNYLQEKLKNKEEESN